MKVAIVGTHGYISTFLLANFPQSIEIIKIGLSIDNDWILDLNLADRFDYDLLDDVDYVIFTAAISSPDLCAQKTDLCWNVNVGGTKYFIENAIRRKCNVLFLSSDAVFGDIPGEIYTEDSATRPFTPYGCMKKEIEDYFRGNIFFKAIRLSYVVSKKDRFVSYCLNCLEANSIAEIFHPFYRNCIVIQDVLDAIVWLLNHWFEFEFSVLNIAGQELVSRVRIADEINRLFDNKLQYHIVCPDSSFYKNRPSITQMKSLYIQSYKILTIESFTEKLKKEFQGVKL